MSNSNPEIDAITEQLKSGDMSIEEAISESAKATTLNVTQVMRQEFETEMARTLQERDKAAAQARFENENPDFAQLRDSGALNKIKAGNPLHDDFSAFWDYKARNPKAPQTSHEPEPAPAKKPAKRLSKQERLASMLEAYRGVGEGLL